MLRPGGYLFRHEGKVRKGISILKKYFYIIKLASFEEGGGIRLIFVSENFLNHLFLLWDKHLFIR